VLPWTAPPDRPFRTPSGCSRVGVLGHSDIGIKEKDCDGSPKPFASMRLLQIRRNPLSAVTSRTTWVASTVLGSAFERVTE
jgi:hypothetical protein